MLLRTKGQARSLLSADQILRSPEFRRLLRSGMSSGNAQPTGTEDDESSDASDKGDPPSFGATVLRGAGQVIFLNSPASGSVILGGLAVADPYLATLTLAGAATSTLSAQVGGLDRVSLNDGLWGYNGALVGCVTAVFLHPLPESIAGAADAASIMSSPVSMNTAAWGLASTAMGASIAPFVGLALRETMGGVPQWTIAFNAIALGALLRTQPLAAAAQKCSTADEIAPEASTAAISSLDPTILMAAPLRGISEIFVVDSAISGGAIVGATALYSPGLAAHLLLGSIVGSATGYILCDAPMEEIANGLWGYNAALTSIGVGVFFVHSSRTVLLSVGGASATAGVFAALKGVFGAFGAPCLTLPFCTVMSGCYVLGRGGVPGLALASSPHSPERNQI